MDHKSIHVLFRYKIGTILFYFSWIRWFYLNEKKQQKWSSPQAICSTYIVPYAWDKLAKLRLSRPDRSPITRSKRPTATRFRPEPKVQSVGGGFPFSRTDTGGSSGRFASPKPEQPELDRSCIKNPAKPAKSSQIRRDFDQIWQDLNQSG